MSQTLLIEPQAHHHRYKPLYAELGLLGAKPQALARMTKKPAFGSVRASLVANADEACEMLRLGYNLGRVAFLESLPGHNPHGIEVLDIDSPDHDLDLSPFMGLMTRRQGEMVRHHLWFRRPNPHLPRRGARKGSKRSPSGSYDLMPWNSVLPGSIHPDGSLYELYVWAEGEWVLWDGVEPLDLLNRLPVVDPEPYRPRKQVSVFDVQRQEEIRRPFLTHPGTLPERERVARNFIRGAMKRGMVSRSGSGGRSTLAKLTSHLMGYLSLSLETAYRYLTEPLYERGFGVGSRLANGVGTVTGDRLPMWNRYSWNACCVNGATGERYPWTREELVEALEWGAQSVPAYGVILWEKAVRKEHAKACLRHFIGFLRRHVRYPLLDTSVPAEGLYRAFLGLYGMAEADCSKHRFCVAMSTAIKLDAVPFRKSQQTAAHTIHYKGLTLVGLEKAFAAWTVDHPLPLMARVIQGNTQA